MHFKYLGVLPQYLTQNAFLCITRSKVSPFGRYLLPLESNFHNNDMSIKYEIQSIKNSKGSGKEQTFVRIFENAPKTDHQLECHMQSIGALTEGAVQTVLATLRDSMADELAHGNRFHIPGVGYFSLAVDLDMPDDKAIDKVRGDYISVRNIKFRPDAKLLAWVKGRARFERAAFSSKSRQYADDELLDKIKEFIALNNCITRRDLEQHFGLRQTAALKCLRHFTETGELKKGGAANSPVYFRGEK